jgi:hypothetical protein
VEQDGIVGDRAKSLMLHGAPMEVQIWAPEEHLLEIGLSFATIAMVVVRVVMQMYYEKAALCMDLDRGCPKQKLAV